MLRNTLLFMLLSIPVALMNAADRDARADELADAVMEAMGGQENYNNTRYITWKFFGFRLHVWDKHTGRIRYENGQGTTVLMNVNTKEGQAFKEGQTLEGEELAAALKEGYEAWINDSYWLVMPYKLKDPGVNLVYSGEGKMESGADAWILTLTFNEVGVTPENKYDVFINKNTNLVEQWNFYSKADDAEPRFKSPWVNWQKHGSILLSDDRGEGSRGPRKHTDIAVFDELPDSVFNDPAPADLGFGAE